MRLKQPTVGPIVGFTDSEHSRVWFRGSLETIEPDYYQRCFGVLRFRSKGQDVWQKIIYNKMSPNFDMTAVFVIEGLNQETAYEYQVGWLTLDTELELFSKLPDDIFIWPNEVFTFTSGSSDSNEDRSYITGSCRYLLRLFGLNIFDDRGDKIFESIDQQASEKPINGIIMMGDQIYADDLNLVSPDKYIKEFFERYRLAFSQPSIRRVMSKYPTYMILDDHEIEDNWPKRAESVDLKVLYPSAIHAYQVYQASHSPLFQRKFGRITGTPTKLWYTFSDGCANWFIMDTRTEREIVDDVRKIISENQLKEFTDWLLKNPEEIKFVVSSVPFFPDLLSESDDKWGFFNNQRDIILKFIKDNSIKNIFFVSGDVHCSFCCAIQIGDIKVHQIVSSSFFWPYPHMSAGDFNLADLKVNSTNLPVNVITELYTEDNFARIDASFDNQKVIVSFFDRKGEPLGNPAMLEVV